MKILIPSHRQSADMIMIFIGSVLLAGHFHSIVVFLGFYFFGTGCRGYWPDESQTENKKYTTNYDGYYI